MILKDYYEILGVKQKATPEEIRDAYKKLAKAYHPDKHQGDTFFAEKFKSLQEAYAVLADEDKRKEYDTKLAEQLNAQNTQKKQHTPTNNQQKNTTEQPSPSHSVVDLPTLVDMYFQKRVATVQARKFYDGFIATPRKRYISWLKFIIALLLLAANIALLHPTWGVFKDLLP